MPALLRVLSFLWAVSPSEIPALQLTRATCVHTSCPLPEVQEDRSFQMFACEALQQKTRLN